MDLQSSPAPRQQRHRGGCLEPHDRRFLVGAPAMDLAGGPGLDSQVLSRSRSPLLPDLERPPAPDHGLLVSRGIDVRPGGVLLAGCNPPGVRPAWTVLRPVSYTHLRAHAPPEH